jgi:acetylglutamate kinase
MAAVVARPIVVKVGGALLSQPDALGALWEGVRQLRLRAPVVVVHGGGPQATAAARRLGHEPRIVHGRRVTSDLDLQIMQWTLRGELNTSLVAQAHARGLAAVGLSGVDGGLLRVVKRPPWVVDGASVDFGWVGDVEQVEPAVVRRLLEGGFLPVIAPLGVDARGQVYNVNADTVACALAGALHAAEFLLVAEAGGLRRDPHDAATRLPLCDRAAYAAGVDAGWIQGGMRVKLKVAFDALDAGIPTVHILPPDDLVARVRGTHLLP